MGTIASAGYVGLGNGTATVFVQPCRRWYGLEGAHCSGTQDIGRAFFDRRKTSCRSSLCQCGTLDLLVLDGTEGEWGLRLVRELQRRRISDTRKIYAELRVVRARQYEREQASGTG